MERADSGDLETAGDRQTGRQTGRQTDIQRGDLLANPAKM